MGSAVQQRVVWLCYRERVGSFHDVRKHNVLKPSSATQLALNDVLGHQRVTCCARGALYDKPRLHEDTTGANEPASDASHGHALIAHIEIHAVLHNTQALGSSSVIVHEISDIAVVCSQFTYHCCDDI